MGHLFNCYPFVDDRLKQLLKEEVMNVHQLVLPTTTIIVPNVFVLGTKAMNPGIVHTTIFVNYQLTWSQLVTPIVPCKTSVLPTSTYPMWYNVIPIFMPLDPSLYRANPIRIKGLYFLMFRDYTCYVPRNVYPVFEQPIVPSTIYTILCWQLVSYISSTNE
jgi:hypothetical protein